MNKIMKTHILLTKNNKEIINMNEVKTIKFETTKAIITTNYRIMHINYDQYDRMEITNYE